MTHRRPATEAEAKALASPLRLRILRITLDEPRTNKEIAEHVAANPATVLHHVRTLVDTGFLEALPARTGTRGAREVPYRSTGKSWHLNTVGAGDAMTQAFLTEVEAVPAERRTMSRLGLRLPAAELEELQDRLAELLQEFQERPRDPQAEPWSLFLALHPDLSATEPGRDPQAG